MNALNKTVIWLWVATCVLLVVTGVMYALTPEDGGANIGLGLLLVFVLPAVAIVTRQRCGHKTEENGKA